VEISRKRRSHDFDAIKLQDIVLDDAVSMVQESARLDENSRRNQQNEVLIAENDSGDTRNGQEDKKGLYRYKTLDEAVPMVPKSIHLEKGLTFCWKESVLKIFCRKEVTAKIRNPRSEILQKQQSNHIDLGYSHLQAICFDCFSLGWRDMVFDNG